MDIRYGIPVSAGLVACLWAAVAAGADPLHETFYAPFDGTPDAVVARGLGTPYQARVDAYEDGVVGKAARSVKRYNGMRASPRSFKSRCRAEQRSSARQRRRSLRV